MTALSTIHNLASIGWDTVHNANVGHEMERGIAYELCISTSYIPLLLLGGVECY
jgi:hypothetical protein